VTINDSYNGYSVATVSPVLIDKIGEIDNPQMIISSLENEEVPCMQETKFD
jgi:hypothetical protein